MRVGAERHHNPASFAARRLTRSAPAACARGSVALWRVCVRRALCAAPGLDEHTIDKRISEAVYSGRLIDFNYYGKSDPRSSACARSRCG